MITYQRLVQSKHPIARIAREVRQALLTFTLPAPKVIVQPILWLYIVLRSITFFLRRVLICEPLFKAYCKQYGKGVRTDIYLHWVSGKGDILLGDDVLIDGRCGFSFASRFNANPTLKIGSHTHIGYGCAFTIGKEITIGEHCLLSSEILIADSNGHPKDANLRRMGAPPEEESVRPVHIMDNVWIGRRAIILPGVTIGENSIVGAGAVVTKDVAPNSVVAGNPARVVANLPDGNCC